jgi:hypothetical protein
MISRRGFLGLTIACMLAADVASAGQAKVYLVNGPITTSNYKGFEQFLFNSMDTIIGLKVDFSANENASEGEVFADATDNQFVAYLIGANRESEIVATENFQYLHGNFVVDGFFVVKSGGMHQGVVSLYLQKTDEAQVRLSSAKILQIQADRLDPKHKKKN